MITHWLCNRALKYASRGNATEADKIMASCIFSYNRMLTLMKECGHVLTEHQAKDFFDFTLKHLQCYAWMHSFGQRAILHQPGRMSYLVMPKLHHMWHLAHDILRNQINPSTVMLLSAESFVGIVGRIARATHRSTVSIRTLERYLTKLYFTLQGQADQA